MASGFLASGVKTTILDEVIGQRGLGLVGERPDARSGPGPRTRPRHIRSSGSRSLTISDERPPPRPRSRLSGVSDDRSGSAGPRPRRRAPLVPRICRDDAQVVVLGSAVLGLGLGRRADDLDEVLWRTSPRPSSSAASDGPYLSMQVLGRVLGKRFSCGSCLNTCRCSIMKRVQRRLKLAVPRLRSVAPLINSCANHGLHPVLYQLIAAGAQPPLPGSSNHLICTMSSALRPFNCLLARAGITLPPLVPTNSLTEPFPSGKTS